MGSLDPTLRVASVQINLKVIGIKKIPIQPYNIMNSNSSNDDSFNFMQHGQDNFDLLVENESFPFPKIL